MTSQSISDRPSYLVVSGWAEPEDSLSTLRAALSRHGEVRYLSWSEIYQHGHGSLQNGLETLADTCGPETVAVGWSLGAMMLLELLSKRRFKAAVLFGVNAKFTAEPPLGCGERALEVMGKRFSRNPMETVTRFYFESFGQGIPLNKLAERARSLVEAVDRTRDPERGDDVLKAGLEYLQNHETGAELERITCPVLVVGAQEDQIVPPQGCADLANNLPRGDFLLAEGPHGWLVQRQRAAAEMVAGWCSKS